MKRLALAIAPQLFAVLATATLPASAAPASDNIIVAPGETLWRIANRVRPDNDVAIPQVIYALWQANPALKQAQSLHQLASGSQLKVPPRSTMLQTPEAKARQWYTQALARPTSADAAEPRRSTAASMQAIAQAPTGFHREQLLAPTPVQLTASAAAPSNVMPASQPEKITETAWYHDIQTDYTLELQQRYYSADGAQGQGRHYSSAALSADWYWQSTDRRHQLSFQPYVRWDARDTKRSLLDLRQAYWQYVGDGFDIKAGVDIVFWGVTESQHLVDVINQTDILANIDAETKLGQPMLNWNLHGTAGSLSLYLLPYFRERPQAGPDGRLRPALLVDNNPLYESGQQERNLDFALRYSQQLGAIDLGLSYFEGNSREPLYNLTAAGWLQPVYLQMQQLGVDSLWISGSWLWKLESIYRKTRQQDFVAATAGFEYTWVGLLDSNWDLGWIAEYQYDSRGRQATVPGQNDVFVAARFVANDAAGSEILLGLLQDLDHSSSQSGKLEASMRLSNSLRVRLDAWFFRSKLPGEPTYFIRRDDYLQLSLDYYF